MSWCTLRSESDDRFQAAVGQLPDLSFVDRDRAFTMYPFRRACSSFAACSASKTGDHGTSKSVSSCSSSATINVPIVGTALHETDDTFQFLLADNGDLHAIMKTATGTRSTEVQVLCADTY